MWPRTSASSARCASGRAGSTTPWPPTPRPAPASACAAYLAYRRAGGENHSGTGRLALAIGEQLSGGQAGAAAALLREETADPNRSEQFRTFVACLTAITQGSRDPALAETAGLHYSQAAEILLLLERLPAAGGDGQGAPPRRGPFRRLLRRLLRRLSRRRSGSRA
jgi:hypothetical protein